MPAHCLRACKAAAAPTTARWWVGCCVFVNLIWALPALCAGGLQRTQGPLERQRSLRWEERLRVTQSSLGSQEPILALRRQLASLSGAEAEAGECWLQLAKLCRGTGHYEAATTAVLEAVASRVPSAALEHVQLLWDKGQPYRAVSEAQLLARLAQEHKLAAPFGKEADHSRFHAQVGGVGGREGGRAGWAGTGGNVNSAGGGRTACRQCHCHQRMMCRAAWLVLRPACLPAGGAAAGAVDGGDGAGSQRRNRGCVLAASRVPDRSCHRTTGCPCVLLDCPAPALRPHSVRALPYAPIFECRPV